MAGREQYDPLAHGDDFTVAVYSLDDMNAVLRAHVHFERHLESMLLIAVPNCEPFLDALMFSAKLKIARNLRIIDKPFNKALAAFNTIRNTFAHGFKRAELNAETDEVLMALMPALIVRDDKIRGSELMEFMAGRWKQAHRDVKVVPDGIAYASFCSRFT